MLLKKSPFAAEHSAALIDRRNSSSSQWNVEVNFHLNESLVWLLNRETTWWL
jgi:hypothetical protein